MIQNPEQKIFNLELLQAINDWQSGGSAKQNQRRGTWLEELCIKLPEKYRTCSLMCFRQIALPKGGVWLLLAENNLKEKISSWTVDIEIAKEFKGGVPPEGQGYQGVIFLVMPTIENLIVNLRELYKCPEFQLAIEQHRPNIEGYDKGIGRYKGNQSEVVLKIESVNQEDVYSLGGHSSPFEKLVGIASDVLYGRITNAEEKEALLIKVENCRADAGPRWLSMEATFGVINRTKPKAEKLAREKKLLQTE